MSILNMIVANTLMDTLAPTIFEDRVGDID